MKIAVRYFSRTGHTKLLAESIADTAGVSAWESRFPLEEKYDVVFLGSAVYNTGIDGAIDTFLKLNAKNIRLLVCFSSTAILRSSYPQVRKLAEKYGIRVAEEEFHCRGSLGPLHKGHPDMDDIKAAGRFAAKILQRG